MEFKAIITNKKEYVLKALIAGCALLYMQKAFAFTQGTQTLILIELMCFIAISIFLFCWEGDKLKERRFFIAFLVTCFLYYLFWMLVVPYDYAPDEYMRYQVPLYIFENGSLPYGWEEPLRDPYWGFSYAFRPSLPALISFLFMKLASFVVSNDNLYLAARLVSLFSSIGTICISYKIGKELFGQKIAKLLIIFIAFLPQFAYISSYVNNDAFGVFCTVLIIYGMILGDKHSWDIKSCIILGIGCGLCLLSYYNCFVIIITALVFAMYSVLSNRELEDKWKVIGKSLILVAGIALIIAGWAYLRNAMIYDGDFLGNRTIRYYQELYAQPGYKPSDHWTPNRSGMSLSEMLFGMDWARVSLKSMIGVFGYMVVYMDAIVYLGFYAILGGGLLANLCYPIFRNRIKLVYKNSFWVCMILQCVLTIGLSLYYSYFIDMQPQGRYLMPMYVSLVLLITSGWKGISELIPKRLSVVFLSMLGLMYMLLSFKSIFYMFIYLSN